MPIGEISDGSTLDTEGSHGSESDGDAIFTGSAQSLIWSSGLGHLGKLITEYGVDNYFHMYHRFRLALDKCVIKSAFLTLYRFDDNPSPYDTTLPDIIVTAYVENVNSSTKPTTWSDANTNMANNTGHSSTVYLTPPPAPDGNLVQFDLTNHIQAIVNRSGWVNNNYIGVYLKTTSPGAGLSQNDIKYYTRSVFNNSYVPTLTIKYEAYVPKPAYDKAVEDDLIFSSLLAISDLTNGFEQELTITDENTFVLDRIAVYEDELEITDEFRENRTYDIEYIEPLSFDDFTDLTHAFVYDKTVNDDYVLDDEILGNNSKIKQNHDYIEFGQDITVNWAYEQDYEDVLDIVDENAKDRHDRSWYDDMLFEQTIDRDDLTRILELFEQELTLDETIVADLTLSHKSVEDELTITDVNGRFE